MPAACCRSIQLGHLFYMKIYINYYGSWSLGKHANYHAYCEGLVSHEIDSLFG